MDKDRIPVHIAIVMDGNGRWATAKGIPRLFGHNAGMEAMKAVVRRASDIGVRYLTVYAFSTENWKRTMEEVSGIFGLIVTYVNKDLGELHRNNVKVKVMGDYGALPKNAVKSLEKTLETTAGNDGLQFNIALNYGSRAEMLMAVKSIAADCAAGVLDVEGLDDGAMGSRLYTAGVPDPDLIIRTGGEKRLSNFLLWQGAYSELVFTEVLWPDFTPEEFEKAIEEYQGRERRFGGRQDGGKV